MRVTTWIPLLLPILLACLSVTPSTEGLPIDLTSLLLFKVKLGLLAKLKAGFLAGLLAPRNSRTTVTTTTTRSKAPAAPFTSLFSDSSSGNSISGSSNFRLSFDDIDSTTSGSSFDIFGTTPASSVSLGDGNLGSFDLGSSTFGSNGLGSSSFGSNGLGSSSFGSNGLGSSVLSSSNSGSSSGTSLGFGTSLGTSLSGNSNFGVGLNSGSGLSSGNSLSFNGMASTSYNSKPPNPPSTLYGTPNK